MALYSLYCAAYSLTHALICRSLCNGIIFVVLIHMQMTGRHKSTDHDTRSVSRWQASAAAVFLLLHQWHDTTGGDVIQLLQLEVITSRRLMRILHGVKHHLQPSTTWSYISDWRVDVSGVFLKVMRFPTASTRVEFLMLTISTRASWFHDFTYIFRCCFIFSCCLHVIFVLFAVFYCAALCVIKWLIDWLNSQKRWLATLHRITLNIASDYRTNGLYRTLNPNPKFLTITLANHNAIPSPFVR